VLEDFHQERRDVSTGVTISYRIGGSGPPLLLLHGYPQSHVMWTKVAPELYQHFTLVMADLRGYGDSGKPESDSTHAAYSFRAMAEDQVSLMGSLGFGTFAVAGHDRGGRVTHRMCLDHASRITRAAVLDIAPTLTMYERTDMDFAMGYYHWFFLTQPHPLPETLIAADPAFYLRSNLANWSKTDPEAFARTFLPQCLAEYERCYTQPETIHSTCEDYRAAAGIDLEHDRADREAGRKITCPLLALWGEKGLVHRTYDVLETWKEVATGEVIGQAIPAGHFLAEEAPEPTARALRAFLRS